MTEFDSQQESLSIGEKDFSRLYYYDCRIKMAYMAKYFEMKFVSVLHESWGINMLHELKERYYINSKSLSLLEPKVGDLVLVNPEHPFYVSYTNDNALKERIHKDKWPYKVYMRNGMVFIWPETAMEDKVEA